MGQRPWSDLSRNNESCVRYTGHDIEQLQFLYDLCEQSIKEYCANRKRQTTDTDVPYLLPINLLAITVWYLKHYHFEQIYSIRAKFWSIKSQLFSICDNRHAIFICISKVDPTT